MMAIIRRFLSWLFHCPTPKDEHFHHLEKYYSSKIPNDQLMDIGHSHWKHIGGEEENLLEHDRSIKQFYSKFSDSNTSNSSKYYAEYAVENSRFDLLRWLIEKGHLSSETTCLFGGSLLYHAIDLDIDSATQSGDKLNLEITKFLLNNGINKFTKEELGIGRDVIHFETTLEDIRKTIQNRGGKHALQIFDQCMEL